MKLSKVMLKLNIRKKNLNIEVYQIMEHSSQRMWFKLHYQSLKIRLDRITKCTGGNTVAWVGDEHSYLICLHISLASMIHFLKNCFQNVLMTSRPRPPRTRWCFSVLWLSESLFGVLLGCLFSGGSYSSTIPCSFPVLLQHCREQWGQTKIRCLGYILKIQIHTHLLGYSWRDCHQEWGRQQNLCCSAWLHRNDYLLLFLASRMKYLSPLEQCYQV